LLLRGDLSKDRYTKTRIVHEGSEMITGLGFRETVVKNGTTAATAPEIYLYIVTTARIICCMPASKDSVVCLFCTVLFFGIPRVIISCRMCLMKKAAMWVIV
jgi:hypothetical protein